MKKYFYLLPLISICILTFMSACAKLTKEQITNLFYEDQILLEEVVQHFTEMDYIMIRIHNSMPENEMSVSGSRRILIEDEELLTVINNLRNRGYIVIGRSGNVVRFVRWVSLDKGIGVAFSINGDPLRASDFEFLTRLVPLSVEGWFYFEEDFDEWRVRRRYGQLTVIFE